MKGIVRVRVYRVFRLDLTYFEDLGGHLNPVKLFSEKLFMGREGVKLFSEKLFMGHAGVF